MLGACPYLGGARLDQGQTEVLSRFQGFEDDEGAEEDECFRRHRRAKDNAMDSE